MGFKKLLLALGILLIPGIANATTYYMVNASGNWNTAGTWSTISTKSALRTGATGANPTTADACIIDDWSSNGGGITLTVDQTTSTCGSVDFNGGGAYAGTLTFTSTKILTVNGNITLSASMTLSGPGTLRFGANGTLASNGATISGAFQTQAFNVILLGNAIVTGLCTTGTSAQINFTVAETITCNGGLTLSAASGTGTATIIIGGGSWLGNFRESQNLTIAGNVTLSGIVSYGTGTLTYSSGSVTTTSSTLTLTTCTLNTAGIIFNNISIPGSSTITLTSNLTATGSMSAGGNTLVTVITGPYDISVGNLTLTGSAGTNTFTLDAGRTITVTGSIKITSLSSGAFIELKSGTPSSDIFLNYSGTLANENAYLSKFTDVNASGSAVRIYNYFGSTLTRTTNITNVDASNLSSGGGFFIQ